jgi:hypothetical protein
LQKEVTVPCDVLASNETRRRKKAYSALKQERQLIGYLCGVWHAFVPAPWELRNSHFPPEQQDKRFIHRQQDENVLGETIIKQRTTTISHCRSYSRNGVDAVAA